MGVVETGTFDQDTTVTGIQDMGGNAAEWVFDWYDATYYGTAQAGVIDPTGPDIGRDRVIRGGSWEAVPFFSRTVHRRHAPPEDSGLWLGFRCAEDFVEVQPNVGTIDTGAPEAVGPDTEAITDEPLDAQPTLEPLELPETSGSTSGTSTDGDAPAVPPVPPGG